MASAKKHMERSHRSYHQKPYKHGRRMWKNSKIPRLTFIELLKAMARTKTNRKVEK